MESWKNNLEEELKNVRQENFNLKAQVVQFLDFSIVSKFVIDGNIQINQLTSSSSDVKKEPVTREQRELSELERLISVYQSENEKLCKQIKQIEQQHKQIEKSMFEENEKLRKELGQTKLLLEQYENTHMGAVKKQSSTIVLKNLDNNDNDKSLILNENQQLKNEITSLKTKLTATLNKEHKSQSDDSQHSLDQRRIKDLERQVKELGN